MPRPALRTRNRRRKYRSLPGGCNRVFYRNKNTSNPKCSNCGSNLSFLSHSASKIRRLPKSQRRISRAYSGQLCHICLRNLLKQASQNL